MTNTTRWDRVVRATHWSVALGFLINYFITEAGSDLHEWIGYGVVALVLIRLVWGLLTQSEANLFRFLPSPSRAIAHIKQVLKTGKDDHKGHNPAGAVMIWCMWSGLLLIGLTGYLMETDQFWGEDWVKTLHELFVNLTFMCVGIHVAAVIIMSRITGHAYVKAMLKNDE